MAVLDSTFLVDVYQGAAGAKPVVDELAKTGEVLYVPSVAAVEFAAGEPDPGLAWARLRDHYVVMGFTEEMAEEATPLARRLWKSGSWPGMADFVIGATAVLLREPLISEDHKAFAKFPGLTLRTYRR